MRKNDTETVVQKASRASIYHSSVTDHFHGSFPLFLNRWEEGFELREHNHAYVEIVYVMSGEGFHYVGGRVERTTKGCLYILPVGTSHIMRPSGTSANSRLFVYNLCIRSEFVAELKSWLSRYDGDGKAISLLEGEPGTSISLVDPGMELGRWFEQMYREYSDKQSGYEASLFASLIQLVVRVSRLLAKVDSPSSGSRVRSALTPVLEYIDAHVLEPLTVQRLAAMGGMSERHFIRLFRQAAGMSFSQYVQHRRVEYACRLLIETDYKIDHIAKSTGYRDTAHFRMVFRKLTGASPGDYRTDRRQP